MAWVFAVPIVALVVLLVVGSITGNVKKKSSCCVSDPHRCDPRMWDGFLEDANATKPSQPLDGR
jgi:hypothetical protein